MKKMMIAATLAATMSSPVAAKVCGSASWYALHSKTASGERMNPSKLTAAHRSYKFGTRVSVTNMRNGKSVIVRINDRGPFIRGRIIDISKAAAIQIGMMNSGHAKVCINHHTKQKIIPKKQHKNLLEMLFSK